MDKVADLLEKLAAKLGTTVEYLWPRMVEKTKIDWMAETVVLGFLLLLSTFLLRYAFKGWDEYNARPSKDYSDEPKVSVIISSIVGGGMALIGGLGFFINLSKISRFLSPEAATLYSLLEMLK